MPNVGKVSFACHGMIRWITSNHKLLIFYYLLCVFYPILFSAGGVCNADAGKNNTDWLRGKKVKGEKEIGALGI